MSNQGSPARLDEAKNNHKENGINPEARERNDGENPKNDGRRSRSGSYHSYRSNDRPKRRDNRRSRSRGSRSNSQNKRTPTESTQVYVAGIDRNVTADHLREAF